MNSNFEVDMNGDNRSDRLTNQDSSTEETVEAPTAPSEGDTNQSREEEECFVIASDIDEVPDPDEEYLPGENLQENYLEDEDGDDYYFESPNYDYLGLDYIQNDENGGNLVDNDSINVGNGGVSTVARELDDSIPTPQNTLSKPSGVDNDNDHEYTIVDMGEEYILGTLMVRVLQARNLKYNPHQDGGGIAGLLNNHRRTRHHKEQNRHYYNMSPLSGGGNLTPSTYQNMQLYSKLIFRGQTEYTSNAAPSTNGDFHWSRGDQSYFDVACPSYPLRMNQFHSNSKLMEKDDTKLTKSESIDMYDTCCEPSKIAEGDSNRQQIEPKRFPPPILHVSLYSKKGGGGKGAKSLSPKKAPMSPKKAQKSNEFDEDDDQIFIGNCSINILQILTGKTPYFDEWCTLHNDRDMTPSDDQGSGRIRVVIEYEPTDPPPRWGDKCVLAYSDYPKVEKDMYPIPSYSIRTSNKPVIRSCSSGGTSSTTLSSTESALSATGAAESKFLVSQPKQFNVEETVGDHVVLSYQTPNEGWNVTFEIHRYNVLVTHRHYGTVEKYKEHVLDFCDNISQSPMVGAIVQTVDTVPMDGLLHVGTEVLGSGVALLGRWWEVGIGGAFEDVVDATNLDGRYSHLSDEEEEVQEDGGALNRHQPGSPQRQEDDDLKFLEQYEEEKEALPGMPCCPITGLPMVDPVVAADGHTYERRAIARWFHTSNRSPLTGSVMSHANLAPNYLLLSSLGDKHE